MTRYRGAFDSESSRQAGSFGRYEYFTSIRKITEISRGGDRCHSRGKEDPQSCQEADGKESEGLLPE